MFVIYNSFERGSTNQNQGPELPMVFYVGLAVVFWDRMFLWSFGILIFRIDMIQWYNDRNE